MSSVAKHHTTHHQAKRTVCTGCQRPIRACHCHLLININNITRVLVLQHEKEAKHALNTVQLLAQCLRNIDVITTKDSDIHLTAEISPNDSYLLFPHEQALTLKSPIEADKSQIITADVIEAQLSHTKHIKTLVVLDATWRKANKMLTTSPQLQSLHKVQLDIHSPRGYTLRKAKSANMLSTLEAVAHSLAAIECDSEQYSPLLAALDQFMQLHSRHIPPEHLEKIKQRI